MIKKITDYLIKNKPMPSNDLTTYNENFTSETFGTILNQRSAALQSTLINRSFLRGSNNQTEESIDSDSESKLK